MKLLLTLRRKWLCGRKWHGPYTEGQMTDRGRVFWYRRCLACGKQWDGKVKEG